MQKKTLKKLIFAGALSLLCIICIMLYSCMGTSSRNNVQIIHQQHEKIEHYASFIKNWNQFAETYSFHYRLLGASASSPSAVLNTLKQWCAAFSTRPSEQYSTELARLSEELPVSTFQAYENFRQEHYRYDKLILTDNMSEQELALVLNTYAGIRTSQGTPNYLTAETVKTILYMNNICTFFNGEKDSLHEQGIDTNIYHCQDLSTNGKYPALDSLLK